MAREPNLADLFEVRASAADEWMVDPPEIDGRLF